VPARREWPPNFVDRTAEARGTIFGLVGATSPLKTKQAAAKAKDAKPDEPQDL